MWCSKVVSDSTGMTTVVYSRRVRQLRLVCVLKSYGCFKRRASRVIGEGATTSDIGHSSRRFRILKTRTLTAGKRF